MYKLKTVKYFFYIFVDNTIMICLHYYTTLLRVWWSPRGFHTQHIGETEILDIMNVGIIGKLEAQHWAARAHTIYGGRGKVYTSFWLSNKRASSLSVESNLPILVPEPLLRVSKNGYLNKGIVFSNVINHGICFSDFYVCRSGTPSIIAFF